MNEIEAQECYDAIGILLAHRDTLDSEPFLVPNNGLVNSMILDAIQQTLKIDYLPCNHEEYTILDEIFHNDGSEVEIRVKCNNCGHLGVKVYIENEITSWDS